MICKRWSFWVSAMLPLVLRLFLILYSKNLNLGARPEIATPVTSLRRLAEGYWLKQSSMSPYAGSMYHGSPLLLTILGPLVVQRIEGESLHAICSLLFVIADFIAALLIRSTGRKLQLSYWQSLRFLNIEKSAATPSAVDSGDIAALIYLWNPMTILTCVGSSSTPIENMLVALTLFGACSRLVPLAAFGWVMATHLSLYPALLIIPVILLLGYGLDAPPRKLFKQNSSSESNPSKDKPATSSEITKLMFHPEGIFSWTPVLHFIFWALFWSGYVLALCAMSLKKHGGLQEMFNKTYVFILTVQDLSPNIGVLWYFFAEVFDFFRTFFLLVFHMNILFMIAPLAIRLNHRPCFLAFVYVAISSMLKSYPSVGDSALYLSLLGLYVNELADMRFSFVLFCGYIGVSLLSPVMHNLWIWRGTGNANFYFATAIAYALMQIILVVESVGAILNHDRMLKKKVLS
ncbi:hypothetical protein H6P81_017319 [Aristolochia fimbriata]|uniref:GPI transamidase subunit PIG-U n=1 Tax=Aristolochia fimbriata TaxID=158543 RepID=A0AAV7DXU0_ARIFI|nr:hypothetical protein H6P81_017319 [Aristolochia fimbriata]